MEETNTQRYICIRRKRERERIKEEEKEKNGERKKLEDERKSIARGRGTFRRSARLD